MAAELSSPPPVAAEESEPPKLAEPPQPGRRPPEAVEGSNEPAGSGPPQQRAKPGPVNLEQATRTASELELPSRNEEPEEIAGGKYDEAKPVVVEGHRYPRRSVKCSSSNSAALRSSGLSPSGSHPGRAPCPAASGPGETPGNFQPPFNYAVVSFRPRDSYGSSHPSKLGFGLISKNLGGQTS
ncbi:hypothetical protein NDU88_001798 [Pleurodeles waltl]|uniref:Uncharacterized protein n=1 Tax=Pleurodeles waltl TaxID=8319 RepID=A0AAV7L1K6_PLEWA|nr:hypothetical protein NDU88_001798 [Pleurodeles waltl]